MAMMDLSMTIRWTARVGHVRGQSRRSVTQPASPNSSHSFGNGVKLQRMFAYFTTKALTVLFRRDVEPSRERRAHMRRAVEAAFERNGLERRIRFFEQFSCRVHADLFDKGRRRHLGIFGEQAREGAATDGNSACELLDREHVRNVIHHVTLHLADDGIVILAYTHVRAVLRLPAFALDIAHES